MMRIGYLILTVWAVALVPAVSHAQAADGRERPAFTAQDRTVIERNATLKGLVGRDPGLVRRVLDAIAAEPRPSEQVAGAMERDAVLTTPPPKPSRNPDLDNLERSSPEAAHDLFQLIKKAVESRKAR